jgi:hypothetical protein
MALPEETTTSPVNERSIVASTDRVVDEARIVMKPTSATPIIKAAAVVAVRLGLRIAFSLAVCPGTPRNHGKWCTDHPAERSGQGGTEHRDADEHGYGTESEQRHAGAPEQPGAQERGTESGDGDPSDRTPPATSRAVDRYLSQRRNRGHVARPAGGEHC